MLMFSCHLHFFTKWPVSFTCYCSNTGGMDTEISQQRKQTPELLMWGLEPTTSPSRVQRSATELSQLPTFYSEHVHVCVCMFRAYMFRAYKTVQFPTAGFSWLVIYIQKYFLASNLSCCSPHMPTLLMSLMQTAEHKIPAFPICF